MARNLNGKQVTTLRHGRNGRAILRRPGQLPQAVPPRGPSGKRVFLECQCARLRQGHVNGKPLGGGPCTVRWDITSALSRLNDWRYR